MVDYDRQTAARQNIIAVVCATVEAQDQLNTMVLQSLREQL